MQSLATAPTAGIEPAEASDTPTPPPRVATNRELITLSWKELCAGWESNPPDRPATLSVEEIGPRPKCLDFRSASVWASRLHVRDLRDRLVRTRAPLDPILVARMGGRWIPVDGEYRRRAYRKAQWGKPVPVEYFSGSPAAALQQELTENGKARFPLTPVERLDAAWRLVCLGESSKRAIVLSAGTSGTTVARMRRVLQSLVEKGRDPLSYRNWREARLDGDEANGEFDEDAAVERFAAGLRRVFPGGFMTLQTQVAARAICQFADRAAPDLAKEMAEHVGLDVREFLGFDELDESEECGPDDDEGCVEF